MKTWNAPKIENLEVKKTAHCHWYKQHGGCEVYWTLLGGVWGWHTGAQCGFDKRPEGCNPWSQPTNPPQSES